LEPVWFFKAKFKVDIVHVDVVEKERIGSGAALNSSRESSWLRKITTRTDNLIGRNTGPLRAGEKATGLKRDLGWGRDDLDQPTGSII
jgi:hypothetical protein